MSAAVRERLDEIWTVDVPDGAVDLRGVSPEDRKAAVHDGVDRTAAGEELFVVSDRDPTPVRAYLDEITAEGVEIPSFQVKRQNPETWLARATLP